MQEKINSYKNYYCDAIACALGEYIDFFSDEGDELIKRLSKEEMSQLCQLAVLKNKFAGVREVYLKVPFPNMGRKALEEFGVDGMEILSARQMAELTSNDIVGGRIMLCVEDLLDYKEGILNELSDFLGRLDLPVMITLGKTLEEVGKIVNHYGKSPIELLEDFGFLDRQCYLYGLNFLDKEDQKLLMRYDAKLIFSPISDGEEGRGAINLYNFIYNQLKFGFSSGKCYNIDMYGEGRLAQLNTNNLMYERGLVSQRDIDDALEVKEIDVSFDESLKNEYMSLKEKAKEIAERIKE